MADFFGTQFGGEAGAASQALAPAINVDPDLGSFFAARSAVQRSLAQLPTQTFQAPARPKYGMSKPKRGVSYAVTGTMGKVKQRPSSPDVEDDVSSASSPATVRRRVTAGLDVPAEQSGRRRGDSSIARAMGLAGVRPETRQMFPLPSERPMEEQLGPAPAKRQRAIAAGRPPPRTSQEPSDVPLEASGGLQTPTGRPAPAALAPAPAASGDGDTEEGAPAPKRAAQRPPAVPTEIPTRPSASGGEPQEEDGDDDMEGGGTSGGGSTAPTSSVFGGLMGGLRSLLGLSPAIAAEATNNTRANRRNLEQQAGEAVGGQLLDAAIPGLGGAAASVLNLVPKPGQRGKKPSAQQLLQTGRDVGGVVSQLAESSSGATPTPTPTPTAAPTPPPAPTPQATAPAPDAPPPPPVQEPQPTPSEDPGEGAARSAARAGEEAGEQGGEAVGEDVGETAAKAAGAATGEAVGEAAGDTVLDAIPGVGELASLALNLGLAFGLNKRPKPIPQPTPSVGSFQAGLS
jgi:hypothetical protein